MQVSSGPESSLASEEQPASAEIRRDEEPARTASAEFAELVAREEAASWGIFYHGSAPDAAASVDGCDAELFLTGSSGMRHASWLAMSPNADELARPP